MRRQAERLLAKDHIRESLGTCAIRKLLTPKKDGSWRMCVNSRSMSKINERYRFHIPWLDGLLDQLSGATFFTNLDLKNGFHHIWIRLGDSGRLSLRRVRDCMNGWPYCLGYQIHLANS